MRYLPLSDKDRGEMLKAIGLSTQDELYNELPEKARNNSGYDLDNFKTEFEVDRHLKALSDKNIAAGSQPFFIGAGCYRHNIPSLADHIVQRSEFLTAYTPYQPEISQGTLTVIFEFQSMIAELTGMDIANASMYDGATATVEAAFMAQRLTRKRKNIVVANKLNEDYLRVLNTYLEGDAEISLDIKDVNEETAAVIFQIPDYYGNIEDIKKYRKICDETGAKLVVVVTEIVSLGLLPAPKEADIVVGEAQSIGVTMNFGGPHLGFFACKEEYVRQMPGRLCGITKDEDGKRGFVLTLNAREQHIKRAKATSNICSNQGLNVVAFTVHMALLGRVGFTKLAKLNHHKANKLAEIISKNGYKIKNSSYFNEFVFETKIPAENFVKKMLDLGVFAGVAISDNEVLITATEANINEDFVKFEAALKEIA